MHMAQKTILVTGGAGFVGSHLCKALVAQGHRVISLDNYFTGSKDNHVAGVEYREGHTKDIARHVSETPDIIYHLGEYSRVEQSVLEPEVVEDLNTKGTQGVLEFWREGKCKLVYAGSSTKFGDEGLARHTSPYASTKAENTERVKKLGDELNLPYAITYFYNVYGPGERAGIYGTVIEVFRQMYLKGEPLTVTAPGTQARNFTHVEDIVDGLILVGEKGQGDEFGLGNDQDFTILEVAKLFGSDVLMLPERQGNRMQSGLNTAKSVALGWKPRRELRKYIAEFLSRHPRGSSRERRILVFSTTFYPTEGPAERALIKLIESMPGVAFDVVTTGTVTELPSNLSNTTVYRVGVGHRWGKYLLPVWGYRTALKLNRAHRYLFAWSLLASYGALAAVLLKRASGLPLLITLADQRLNEVSPLARGALKFILSDADQVYGASTQEDTVRQLSSRDLRRSMGEGDAFANQIRFVYSQFLEGLTK